MKKTNLRILSFILALVILTLSLPTFPMVADAAEEETEAIEVGEEILTYTEEVELRDQFTKHFRRSDGKYVAVVYAEPVHAGERGNMTDIDNRLTYRASSGRYESANEEFAVSFAPTPDADRTVSVSFEGYTLSWRVDAVRNLQTTGWKTMSVSTVTPIAVQPERASSLSAASVTDTGFVDASSLAVFTKEQISSTFTSVSKIRYQNAFTGGNGVDLSYTLAPNRLEEDIILKSKNDIRSYVLTMSAEGLTAVKQADNSILFMDGSGKEVFTVGAPWMQDAEYAFSDSITVSLVQKGDTVTVIYTPDAAWLNDADRVYPVLIDPSVRSRNYTSNYEDGMITPTMTSIATTQTSTRVGTTGGYETYTKILSYPKLYSGMSVDSVTMSYYGSRSSFNHKVRILSTEVDFASMTGANRPMGTGVAYSPDVTLISSSSGSYYKHTYDITSAYQSYYYSYGYNALNYIKGFRLYNGDSTVTTGTVYTSSEGAADYRPVLEITYTHSHDVPIASGGVYTLVNKNSGKAMTASSGGTNVYQMTKVITNMQAFTFVGSQGFYTIEPIVRNGEALTWNHSGSTSSQGVTNLYASDKSTADLDKQEFMVLYVSTDDNGYDYYAIVSRADTRYALTASGTANGSASAPTSVTTAGNIYMGLYTGSASQLWRLESGRKPVYVGNNIVENNGNTFAFDYGIGEPMIQPYGYVTAYGEILSWVSSDPSVVSFDTNGKVTIHDIGEVTLTANVTGSGTSRSYSYTVVIAVENGVYFIKNTLTQAYLGVPSVTMGNGLQVKAYDEKGDANEQYNLLWKVYGIGDGKFSIRPFRKLDYGLSYYNSSMCVRVAGADDTTAILDYMEWSFITNSVRNGEIFYRISSKVSPQTSLYSNENGVVGLSVTGQNSQIIQSNGQEWELEQVTLNESSMHLYNAPQWLAPNEQSDVDAIYYSYHVNIQVMNWSSNNESVATVDESSGVVTGVAQGSTVITATSSANPNKSISFTVNVTAVAEGDYLLMNDQTMLYAQPDSDGENHIEQNYLVSSELQMWRVNRYIDHYYTIQNISNSLYLTSPNNTTNGNAIGMALLNDSTQAQQLWLFSITSDGLYVIQSQRMSEALLYLTVGAGLETPGVNIEQRSTTTTILDSKANWVLIPTCFSTNTPKFPQITDQWCWAATAQMMARTQYPSEANTDLDVMEAEQRAAVYHVFGDDTATAETYDWENDPQELESKPGMYWHTKKVANFLVASSTDESNALQYVGYFNTYSESSLLRFLADGYPVCRMYAYRIVTESSSNITSIDETDNTSVYYGGHATVIVGYEWKAEDEEFVFTVFSPNPSGVSEQIMDYVELTASSIQSSAIQDENYIYFWGCSVVVDTSYDQYVVHRY